MTGNKLIEYRSVWICLALTLAAAGVFYQVCTYDFVNYDDSFYVCANPNIQDGITLNSVKWAFSTGYIANWHPITWLSHMLDWQLFSSRPAGHHLTSLILHIANTLLLFVVLKQMTHKLWPSAFVAALFAIHPLHVESVAWVAERKDVLSTFFWMLTMWAYVRFVNRPKITGYLLVVVFFALGLMAKPMLVTLPFVLLLLDYWPLERFGQTISKKHRKAGSNYSLPYLLIEKAPLFAMTLASCIVTFIVQREGGAIYEGENHSLLIRIANASVSYMQYIIKMIWPVRLAMFYPHPGQNVSIQYAIISTVLLLAVTIFILRFARNRRYIATGWFWYLGTLVPVLGLVQVGKQAIADRYTYVPLIGLFIITAWGLPELLGKWPHRRIILRVSSLAVLSVLAAMAYLQQRYWKDTITLCEHALKVTNNNYAAHFCMTPMLIQQGRIDEAIWHNTEAVRIKPNFFEGNYGLGDALYKDGRIDEAIHYYKRAIELCPYFIEVYFKLGAALTAKGNFDEAILLYKKALQISPGLIELHINLGLTLMESGKLAEAAKEYEKILLIQPQNAFVHNNLGALLCQQNRFDEAITHFNQAIQINPFYMTAKNNLNRALAEKQKLQSTENTKK